MADPCAEYPKAAYRLGAQADVWGRMMDIRHLIDREDEEAALSEGWALHPLDVPDDEPDDEPLSAEVIAPEEVRRRPGRPRKVEA